MWLVFYGTMYLVVSYVDFIIDKDTFTWVWLFSGVVLIALGIGMELHKKKRRKNEKSSIVS